MKTRYLEEKNIIEETHKIKFADVGHMYWAYSPFYDDWVHTNDGIGGSKMISTTTILSPHFPSDFDAAALRIWNNPALRLKMENDTTYKYFGCQSPDDIRKIWSVGATKGTEMHAYFEDMCNLIEYDRDYPVNGSDTFTNEYVKSKLDKYDEKKYFFEAINYFGIREGKHKFFRTELLMWHNVLHLSGMIDCLLHHPESDTYVIVDWKRCKNGVKGDPVNPRVKFDDLKPSAKGQLLPAFEKLRNHNYNKYGCQLTLYKHMFQHMTGKKISGMFLVVIDSAKIGKKGCLSIQEIPLNKFDECIGQLFECRARSMLAEHHDTLDDDHMDKLLEFLPMSPPSSPLSCDSSQYNKRQKT